MISKITVRENVERVLHHLGLSGSVVLTGEGTDRVWGWPVGDTLRKYVEEHDWHRDLKPAAEHFHGADSDSFREPDGCHPAMQIVFHPCPAGEFVEIDLDESAPVDVVDALWHAKEVLSNALGRKQTDQNVIAGLLDKRFPKSNCPCWEHRDG